MMPIFIATRFTIYLPVGFSEARSSHCWYHTVRDQAQFCARYSVLQGNGQLFSRKYCLILPTEEEWRVELERDRALLEDAASAKKGEGNE